MAAVGGVVTVAAAFSVVDERSAEAVAQVGDQAGEGGTRKTMLADERSAGEPGAPPVQQPTQAVEFVEFTHGSCSLAALCFNSVFIAIIANC